MNLKRLLRAGKRYLMWPEYRFLINAAWGMYDKMDDRAYLEKKYRLLMGAPLNLENPETFSEKIQWLKLYNRKPEYTKMVDKYAVRELVAQKLGEDVLVPLLGVWENAEDIDFDSLPDQFVLKCNHNSGLGMCICKDKAALNIQQVKKELKKGLAQDYYLHGREWPYKDVPRRIIAEAYIEDEKTGELRDYKFFCFDGEVKALFIATERQKAGEEVKFDFFDADFNHLPIRNGHPNAEIWPEKPVCFEKMKEFAGKLSKGVPHLRVDFYEVNGKVYFGELTFSHFSGMTPFEPEQWDYTFGSWINLPEK